MQSSETDVCNVFYDFSIETHDSESYTFGSIRCRTDYCGIFSSIYINFG